MLDIKRMRRIRLSAAPRAQRVVASLVLGPNYHLPPRTRIVLEGLENLPEGPVIFAMNHTDRYNYWPFQYALWRRAGRFTATWVKGKYYENRALAWFMEMTNNIPTVSRGYLITKDFMATLGRRPSDGEYAALRQLVDSSALDPLSAPAGCDEAPESLFTRARDILGYAFDPARGTYAAAVNALFRELMARFVELNVEAHRDKGLDVIVFPEGTRSVRLSEGRVGLAQIALHLKATVMPVGSNNCDKVYPGGAPFARGGTVTYRIGQPIPYAELKRFEPGEPFVPFTPQAETRHREAFQALVDHVMWQVNGLLDPRHQFADHAHSDGVRGSERFV